MSAYEILFEDDDTVVVKDNIVNLTIELTKKEFEKWKATRLERD